MERAVYFDAWYPRHHCYHPSLPARRLRMIEDLEAYRATALVWSALGGGSISLPYLEEEAWQEIDPRFRFYGFLNDSEFIRHCQERGIKVYGIVFEVQGWEFPVELSEGQDRILSMNEPRGVGTPAWFGLREFTQNTYPKLWKPLEHYFPDELVNSDGEKVTDILEECTSRDIHGNALHSEWVEAPDREHYAYLMDRNNPVWREYLKAIIRIQIDAGVAGVELDEADLPLFSTRYGGCFCKDCVKQFRAYLKELPADRRPKELDGTDLEEFHYGSWLLERGFDFRDDRRSAPLFWDYIRFQRTAVTKHFIEMTDYIREYGRSKGRKVLVACNCGDAPPHFDAFRPHVDLLCAEQHVTEYRQPSWCRYAAGFAGDETELVVVEQPFAGVIPELQQNLMKGRGKDRFRMMQYEAVALGVSTSIPYGSWMGPVVQESLWAPHEVLTEMQDFLADHEDLFSTRTYSETAVVYSVPSAFEHQMVDDARSFAPFYEACDSLVAQTQPFDVLMFPEGELRPDTLTLEDLAQYRTLVLPHCTSLTLPQVDLIGSFLGRGGHVLALGELGANLPEGPRSALLGHPLVTSVDAVRVEDLADGPQVLMDGEHDLAINLQRVTRGVAIHVIRYDYDKERDEVPILPELTLRFRLPRWYRHAFPFTPSGEMGARLGMSWHERGMHRLELRDVPLYSVTLLQG
ncbi:MAG TPA: hypothetical protein VFR44_08895 [Actinomycetota bacterium]|nr:hypothetical protein [Actinomycetota bacterium]